MSNPKPGPYRVEETGTWPETNHQYGIYSDHGTGQVAKIEGYGDEALATANLFAASPKMLSALKHITEVARDHIILEIAYQAIAIAEGREPC